jgi:hypothetical protein
MHATPRDAEPGTSNLEQRTSNLNPEHEPGTWNLELGTRQGFEYLFLRHPDAR